MAEPSGTSGPGSVPRLCHHIQHLPHPSLHHTHPHILQGDSGYCCLCLSNIQPFLKETELGFCRTAPFSTACPARLSPLPGSKSKHVIEHRVSTCWIPTKVKMGTMDGVSCLIQRATVWRDCLYIIPATQVPIIFETSFSFDSENYLLSFQCILFQ